MSDDTVQAGNDQARRIAVRPTVVQLTSSGAANASHPRLLFHGSERLRRRGENWFQDLNERVPVP